MFLLKLIECDAVVVEPVQELDGHGDGLLRSQERAVRHRLHLIQAPLQVPADVAPYDVAMVVGAYSLSRVGCPLVVAHREFVAAGQSAVLGEEGADVGARAVCSRQFVEHLVGDRGRECEFFESTMSPGGDALPG